MDRQGDLVACTRIKIDDDMTPIFFERLGEKNGLHFRFWRVPGQTWLIATIGKHLRNIYPSKSFWGNWFGGNWILKQIKSVANI